MVKTDDAVQKFVDAFTMLKQCFRDRLNLDSWKIACTLKDGVLRLITTTDRIKEIGKCSVKAMFLCDPDVER